MLPKNTVQLNDNEHNEQKPASSGRYTSQPARFPVAHTYKKHHPVRIAFVLALVIAALISATVRLLSLAYDAGTHIQVRIASQQPAVVDLQQSTPISPYLLGANVFPAAGTNSLDKIGSGFMNYGTPITNGLQAAHVKLLRFPGGNWSEDHVVSLDQLNDFSTLLARVGADGMVQVQISASSSERPSDIANRAKRAAQLVDFMNNSHSVLRTGKYAHAPFHPIKFWTIGNEPDHLTNPDTGKIYTVAEYVKTFIQFSTVMHQADPTIKVFGPEISQFYGLGTGLADAHGQLWMEGFLKEVSDYEQLHPFANFHLVDAISLHRYQFDDAHLASALLLSSSSEWSYSIPALHQLIRQDFGRDLPIGVTEINTNPNGAVPSRSLAALWWADTLGALANQQIEYVSFFATEGVETPYPLFTSQNAQQTAMLHVMQVFSHLQHNLVPLAVQREPVSVYATSDNQKQTLSLLFVNKSSTAQLAQVNMENGTFVTSSWPQVNINLNGDSIMVVTLHRGGGAEAYNYTVSNDATPAPATHVVCTNRTDTLPTNTPC